MCFYQLYPLENFQEILTFLEDVSSVQCSHHWRTSLLLTQTVASIFHAMNLAHHSSVSFVCHAWRKCLALWITSIDLIASNLVVAATWREFFHQKSTMMLTIVWSINYRQPTDSQQNGFKLNVMLRVVYGVDFVLCWCSTIYSPSQLLIRFFQFYYSVWLLFSI